MLLIAADHGGFRLKENIKKYLDKIKVMYKDLGAYKLDINDDYPDYAKRLAKKIKGKDKGILICGSGVGMCIAVNRFKNIRAVAAYDNYSAKMSRRDNDSNVICLRGRKFSSKKAKKILKTWLETDFSNKKRYKRRIKKL